MNISAKIFSWDNGVILDTGGCAVEVGEQVIVNFDSNVENATVTQTNVEKVDGDGLTKIIRRATEEDLVICRANKEKAMEAVRFCREMVKKRNLLMKIVDAHFSFDGSKVTFAFIADKRVDFRDLVKDLSREFQRSVRLQQIGSRDEAKSKGGIGSCGRRLCCVALNNGVDSVTIEDARAQQMGQRGSDRLSGLCSRLRCCLGFEAQQYRESLQKFPEEGAEVQYSKKKCIVYSRDIMQQTVLLEFEDKTKKRVGVDEIKF